MKFRIVWICAVAVLALTAGCKKAANPNEEIRAAILKHLGAQGTLNIAAFDTELKQVTLQGDHAQADVVFKVKNGPGSMQLGYNLEKRDGAWAVVESKAVGSDFTHPGLETGAGGAPGGPASGTSAVSGALQNFKTQTGALPPGHPPVSGGAPAAPQGALPAGHPPIDGSAQPAPQKKP